MNTHEAFGSKNNLIKAAVAANLAVLAVAGCAQAETSPGPEPQTTHSSHSPEAGPPPSASTPSHTRPSGPSPTNPESTPPMYDSVSPTAIPTATYEMPVVLPPELTQEELSAITTEYQISPEDFLRLVDQFRINLPADASEHEVVAATTEKLEMMLNASHNQALYSKYENWQGSSSNEEGPADAIYGLYTEAVEVATFSFEATNAGSSGSKLWRDTLRLVLKINDKAFRKGEKPLSVSVEFTPESTKPHGGSDTGFNIQGKVVITCDASQSPSIKNDTRLDKCGVSDEARLNIGHKEGVWKVDGFFLTQ